MKPRLLSSIERELFSPIQSIHPRKRDIFVLERHLPAALLPSDLLKETAVSALLVPDIGEKEQNDMTNKVNYTDAPTEIAEALENAGALEDFLPSPEQLIFKTEKEKITIAIDKNSLELFKKYAKKHGAKYQTMINGVLSSYADKFLSHK